MAERDTFVSENVALPVRTAAMAVPAGAAAPTKLPPVIAKDCPSKAIAPPETDALVLENVALVAAKSVRESTKSAPPRVAVQLSEARRGAAHLAPVLGELL